MRRLALLLTFVAAACGAPDASGSRSGYIAAEGSPEGLPPQAPSRFGFGAAATPERVAAWDIDVRPNGAGLPAGSGTVAAGRQVFEAYCVECHGTTGTEGPNDRLVGREEWGETGPSVKTVGSYWQYPTTLFDYIRRAMPHMTPGLMTPDQTYALVAYILNMNEIVPEDAIMDAETLPRVVMPSRDRFVLDDRQGGSGPIR